MVVPERRVVQPPLPKPIMPVKGTTILPSAGTNTPCVPVESGLDPAAVAVAEAFLVELEVPKRVKFTPSQLATDVGGSRRAWQRECEIGNIDAVRLPGGWIVPWHRLVKYFAKRQNVVESN